MSNQRSNKPKDMIKVYENLVAPSLLDAIRIGINEEDHTAILEFGYHKNQNIINIDVRKVLDKSTIKQLINNLNNCLDQIEELEKTKD